MRDFDRDWGGCCTLIGQHEIQYYKQHGNHKRCRQIGWNGITLQSETEGIRIRLQILHWRNWVVVIFYLLQLNATTLSRMLLEFSVQVTLLEELL